MSLARRSGAVVGAGTDVAEAVGALPWSEIEGQLDERGYAVVGPLLSVEECRSIAGFYDDREKFRSRVVMASHGYGSGEYQYFSYPLPAAVEALREAVYPRLVPVANRWYGAMGMEPAFPPALGGFLDRCHAAGQTRPTPLLLRYREDDHNCLHQDLYGALAFPIQLAVLLSEPGGDFTGGEFLLVEQRPRRQSRPEVVPLAQGQGVIFAVSQRPVTGTRGSYRVTMRHGVSRVRSGLRFCMGVIFHDAA
jgi:hypothetical protein